MWSKIRGRCLVLVLCAVLLGFSACAEAAPRINAPVTVTVVDSECFSLDGTSFSPYGSQRTGIVKDRSITFKLVMNAPYYVSEVDYSDNEIVIIDDLTAYVHIYNVEYSRRIVISCLERDGAVLYDANGGEYLGAYSAPVRVPHPFTRSRPNTLIGTDVMSRQGYVLTGWNSEPDGSGTAVGLGSRYSIERNVDHILYAQWSKWTDPGYFAYVQADDGLRITGYSGTHETVTIPAAIDGNAVVEICTGAFNGIGARKVVFPLGLKRVEENAFIDCGLESLYLYDGIVEIYDESFVGCSRFSTVHINAASPPRYEISDFNANYADKADILIQNADKKKLVMFSGCNAFYSVDALQVEEAYPDYFVINMGFNGYTNAYVQWEVICTYLKEGDVLLHMPESGSNRQLFIHNEMFDTTLYVGLQCNWDLLALADIRNVYGTLSAFTQFNRSRKYAPERRWSDSPDLIDSRGSYAKYRVPCGMDVPISHDANIFVEFLTDDVLENMNRMYGIAEDLGAKVLFGFGPVNIHGLPGNYEALAELFEQRIREGIRYPVITNFSDCLFPGRDFYDYDYHLASPATEIHTQNLIYGLIPYL